MSTDLDSVCRQLDVAFSDYLTLVNAYETRSTRLSATFNSAFFGVTQAKQIMGANSLSRYQYDSRMQASSRIADQIEDEATLTLTHIPYPVPAPPSPDFSDGEGGEHVEDDAHAAHHAFRHRSSMDLSGDGGSVRMPRVRRPLEPAERDPISWFGVLVPLALREAQGHFKSGLGDIVAMAGIRQAMLKKEEEIRALRAEKRRLLA